ncbi:MAG TPA: MFS transporter [Methylomirabilota bacterium]|nr:MFS transporter [Methylomirabilota bacterium]
MRWFWGLLGARALPDASRKKLGIVALLYFIEGSPVSLLWEVLPVYLRLQGVSLRAIGGLRLLELPFSLKVLWSPLVQRFGDRRGWVAGAMAVVAAVAVAIPLVDPVRAPGLLFALLLVLTTAAATQDMAIDSYTVALVDRDERGPANGIRASAYRVALVLLGGGMVTLAAWLPWSGLFAAAGLVLAALGLAALRVPRIPIPAAARRRWLAPFVDWVATWRAVPLVLFVLTYKLGEFAIGPMVKPFWVDQGRSLVEIGMVPTTLGIVLSIAGALAGGAFITRYGVFTSVWALGLPQALSNLGYATVAAAGLPGPALYAASMIDSFAGGLGTAAFLAFLMAVCDREAATVQYAFLTSLFSLTGRLAGAVSGLGAEHWGYATYFTVTFLVSLPAFALLPWLPAWIDGQDRAR